MTEDFRIVDPSEVETESFNTSETAVRKLTEPLGATELRVNQVLVEPGEVTTPHTHEGRAGDEKERGDERREGAEKGQEEVFVAMTDGQIAIEGEVHDVPEGAVVRVRPDTVRNLLNETDDETHVWLAFGTPPVGTVDDFGSYVLAEE
jgi:quercetin dioxygenase-like cupin family protein